MSSHSPDYLPVEQVDEEEGSVEKLLGHHSERFSDRDPSLFRTFWRHYWAFFTHGVLFIVCIALVARSIHDSTRPPPLPYSPANVAVEYYEDLTTFNGTFNHSSIYRGDPTLEIDEAWERVSTGVTLTRITRDDLLKIGKEDSPSTAKYPEEDGGGYMAALEVTHQLHCLNMLRKYLHLDYYGKVDEFFSKSKPKTYKNHLEHCIDNLRQSLMCQADTAIITLEWVRGFSTVYPDFNTKHQCRNFEKIIAWQNDHGVHVPSSRIHRLEGEVDMPYPP